MGRTVRIAFEHNTNKPTTVYVKFDDDKAGKKKSTLELAWLFQSCPRLLRQIDHRESVTISVAVRSLAAIKMENQHDYCF